MTKLNLADVHSFIEEHIVQDFHNKKIEKLRKLTIDDELVEAGVQMPQLSHFLFAFELQAE